jgi:hypothetical protein
MRSSGMVVVQIDRQRVCDDIVIDGGVEQHFLGVAREFRPHFQGRATKQGGELVFVHRSILKPA